MTLGHHPALASYQVLKAQGTHWGLGAPCGGTLVYSGEHREAQGFPSETLSQLFQLGVPHILVL